MSEPPTHRADAVPRPAGAGPRGPRSRLVRRLADVLLIAGGLLLAYPFWSAGYAQVQQQRLHTAYREQTTAFVDAVADDPRLDNPSRTLPEDQMIARLAAVYAEKLDPGDPIGRLKIPAIGLNRIVQQGVSGRASLTPDGDRAILRNGPVHYGNTPLPGEGEPFAVAGHRTTYGAPFNRLDALEEGDPIFVETPYATFRYSVAKTTEVMPDDTAVLRDRGYALVLTTCTPLYSASRRLIVWATLDYARVAEDGR